MILEIDNSLRDRVYSKLSSLCSQINLQFLKGKEELLKILSSWQAVEINLMIDIYFINFSLISLNHLNELLINYN